MPPLKPKEAPKSVLAKTLLGTTTPVNKTINNNTNNASNKSDVVDLTGDDEKSPAKTVNKVVTPVTTGTRIMFMPYVTTNMKSPMVLKLNTGNTVLLLCK